MYVCWNKVMWCFGPQLNHLTTSSPSWFGFFVLTSNPPPSILSILHYLNPPVLHSITLPPTRALSSFPHCFPMMPSHPVFLSSASPPLCLFHMHPSSIHSVFLFLCLFIYGPPSCCLYQGIVFDSTDSLKATTIKLTNNIRTHRNVIRTMVALNELNV